MVEGTLNLLDPEILNLLHEESLILDPCIKYLFGVLPRLLRHR